jgi:hypothetical protein
MYSRSNTPLHGTNNTYILRVKAAIYRMPPPPGVLRAITGDASRHPVRIRIFGFVVIDVIVKIFICTSSIHVGFSLHHNAIISHR